MENFENLSAFDFVTELPSELLNLSPLYQRFSPIHSPDATDTFIELQTVQPIILPTSSNNIEPNFEEKVSCEHLNQPFQSIDPNTEHFRPKRAAALAANIWISNLKRKDDYDSSDKENENYIKSQLKTNSGKRRRNITKKKSSPILEETQENNAKQINFNIDTKSNENINEQFLVDDQIQSAQPILGDAPVDFNQPCQEIGLEFENLNYGLTHSNLNDPFLNNNVKYDTMPDLNNNLNTPTKIDRSLVFCLSDNLYYDDSNYEKDDFGFTISRAVESKFENHGTHLELNFNNSNDCLLDENLLISQDNKNEFENDITEKMFYGGVDLLELNDGKRGDKLIGYAVNVIKVLFSENEIKQGIFPESGGKNRSKSRIPFDKSRTDILKEAIIRKFSYNPSNLKKLWVNIRPAINRRLRYFRMKSV